MGLKLQAGKWLAYTLYLYPKEVDEIMRVLEFAVQEGGSWDHWERNFEKIPIYRRAEEEKVTYKIKYKLSESDLESLFPQEDPRSCD